MVQGTRKRLDPNVVKIYEALGSAQQALNEADDALDKVAGRTATPAPSPGVLQAAQALLACIGWYDTCTVEWRESPVRVAEALERLEQACEEANRA